MYSFLWSEIAEQHCRFIHFVHVTFDSEFVIFNPNLFICYCGTNPTMIYPTVSDIIRHANDPIRTQRGFVLRSNKKRLRLEKVDRKDDLARICQDIHDDVLNNACSPANHTLGDATSPSSNDFDSNVGWLDTGSSN